MVRPGIVNGMVIGGLEVPFSDTTAFGQGPTAGRQRELLGGLRVYQGPVYRPLFIARVGIRLSNMQVQAASYESLQGSANGETEKKK